MEAPLLTAGKAICPSVQLQAAGASQDVRVRSGCRWVSKRVLQNVTATFPPGSLTALMGPSGAGKTTLLGLLRSGRCSQGRVLLNGGRYSSVARKLIKLIPQDDVLLPGLTALEV